MTENERIKEIRLAKGFTLKNMGTILGISEGAVSNIEKGKRNVTEQIRKIICKTDWNGQTVNEEWLRTGEGDMFLDFPEEDEYFRVVTQLQKDPIAVAIIMEYEKWDSATKENFRNLILNVANTIKDEKHEQ